MKQLRALCVLVVLFVITPPLALIQALGLRFGWPVAYTLPRAYHRFMCALLNVRIDRIGAPISPGPCLIAANHVSWLDIPVLSSLGEVRFIAKSEIIGWPVLGWLARLQDTLFVDRGRRSSTDAFRRAMQARFAEGETLVLFAEGTSSDGNRVLPFKTALFGAISSDKRNAAADTAKSPQIPVQPVSITYTRYHGLPMSRRVRPLVAWYGDMEIAPHIWQMLCAGPIDVRVEYHEPVPSDIAADRKQVARYSEQRVRDGVLRGLSGRGVGQAPA